ncbi:MAG TPA: response regulator/pilus assembly protein [Thermoflexia bacterium]|nr:response regulator/pilus assembly protein [Thermoflexia bacterium]
MPYTILIVDDDIEALRLVGSMLERKGYNIQAASSGMQGLTSAVETQPDLIILDIMMPGMDGYEVAKKLRNNPHTTNTPILFFTAKSTLSDKIEGFQSGGDGYLTKPIHPTELITRVEALLQRTARQQKVAIPRGKTIAFLPVKGGTGNSTLALNTAISLSRQAPDKKVILVEFKDGSGSLALQVGNSTDKGLQELLAHKPIQLTREALEGQMLRYSTGLHLLPATTNPAGTAPLLTKKLATSLYAHLTANYDYLLFDLPPSVTPPVSELLRQADYILLSLAPDNITLKLAQKMRHQLQKLNIGEYKIKLALIYRAHTASAITRELIKEQLHQDILGSIPPVPDLAQESWTTRRPMVTGHPLSLLSRQVKMLVDDMLEQF